MGHSWDIIIPMGYSWERITSFAPWVTHGVELCDCKMPQSRYTVQTYLGKDLRHLPQKGYSCNPQRIDSLDSQESLVSCPDHVVWARD